jgi:hypothetical protein
MTEQLVIKNSRTNRNQNPIQSRNLRLWERNSNQNLRLRRWWKRCLK